MSLLRSKRFRRPPREPGEFFGLVAAAGVLLLAVFLALAVWSLSPAEGIGTLRQDVSTATVIERTEPNIEDAAPDLRDRVGDVVRPAVELPGKIANPMDLVPDWPIALGRIWRPCRSPSGRLPQSEHPPPSITWQALT